MFRYVFIILCIGFSAGLWSQESFNIDWVLHTDTHIQRSSPKLLKSLTKHQMVEVDQAKLENLAKLGPSDSLTSYISKIEAFTKRLPKTGPLIFNVILNSHGSEHGISSCAVGSGMIQYDAFYQAIVTRLTPEQIERTRINIVVDACHSGAMIDKVKKTIKSNQAMVPSRKPPKVSIITAANVSDSSYSGSFTPRIDAAIAHLGRIEKLAQSKGIIFCQGCTQIQKIGLLLNSYHYSDQLSPSYWTNENKLDSLNGQQHLLALETAEPEFFEMANLKASKHIALYEPELKKQQLKVLKQISLHHNSEAVRSRAQIKYDLANGDILSAIDHYKQGIQKDIFHPKRWEDDVELVDSSNTNRQKTKLAIQDGYFKDIYDRLIANPKRFYDKAWNDQLLQRAHSLIEFDDHAASIIYHLVKAAFDEPHPNQSQLDRLATKAEKWYKTIKNNNKYWSRYNKIYSRNPVAGLSNGVQQLFMMQKHVDNIVKLFGPEGYMRFWPASDDLKIHPQVKNMLRHTIAEQIMSERTLSERGLKLMTEFITDKSSFQFDTKARIKDWLPRLQLQHLNPSLIAYIIREEGPDFIDKLWTDRAENQKMRQRVKELALAVLNDRKFWQGIEDSELENMMKYYIYEAQAGTAYKSKSIMGQVLHQFSEQISDDVLQSLLDRHQHMRSQSPFFTVYLAGLRKAKFKPLEQDIAAHKLEYEKARNQVNAEISKTASLCELISKARKAKNP